MSKPMQIADWVTIRGGTLVPVEDRGPRRFDVSLVTQGCSIVVHEGERETLVFHGEGAHKLSFGIAGEARIEVNGWKANGLTSVLWPNARDGFETGWRNANPITQLDLKSRDAVSPEVQAMLDAMNRNALRREAALRAEFERKLGQAAGHVSQA